MTWEQLDMAAASREPEAPNEQKLLERAAKAALLPQSQAPLRHYLDRIARGDGYVPGRSHADTAYYDGIRALAAKLLYLGDKQDD